LPAAKKQIMKTKIFPGFNHKMRIARIVLLLHFIFVFIAASLALPTFHCPDDITLGCCSDYKNTDLTGHPADFNQGYSNFSYEDEVFLNECREGYVIRHWTGYVGTTAYVCEQLITMEYVTNFSGNIQWPPDWQGKCGDEIPFLEPWYDRGFCDQIAHTYNDDTLHFVGNVCMKILRNWKVIDWCKYQPNTGSDEGVWEYTQVLKIVETSKPQFASCGDWEIGAENDDCTATALLSKTASDENCNFLPDLNWRIEFDLYNDWSVDSVFNTSGDTAYFEVDHLPIGEHKIIWKVSDRCGNVQQCMELIHVEDAKDPTPYCYLSMPLVLMPVMNMLEVNANHFMKDAKDNCSATEDLVYSWTQNKEDTVRVFDCDDTGFQFLPVYVIDESGNNDFCFIFTRITAHGNCSGNLVNSVEGQIRRFDGSPVEGITLSLGNNPIMIHAVDTTETGGAFAFPYIETLAEPEMYLNQVEGELGGINTLDMVYLMNYLLGLAQPTDVVSFREAADVNADGRVDVADLYLLRDLVLGIHDETNPFKALRTFIPDEEKEGEYREVEGIKDFKNVKDIRVLTPGDLDHYFTR
jgi:hypothetical protein